MDDLAEALAAAYEREAAHQDLLALLVVLPWDAMPPAARRSAERLTRVASGESESLDAEFHIRPMPSILSVLRDARSGPKRRGRKGKGQVRKPLKQSRPQRLLH